MLAKFRPYFLSIIFLLTASATQAATFSLSGGEFKQGCPVSSTINLNTSGASSDAANIIVHYNPAELNILDANAGQSGIQIATGNIYSSYADNAVDTASGIIKLTGFDIGSAYTGSGLFGSIPFASKPGVTSSALTIEYVPNSTTDSNIAEAVTSNDILTGVTNAALTFISGPCTADTQAPRVVSPSPANGATNVPLASNVSFHLTDNQSGVDLGSVVVTVFGTSYTSTGLNQFASSGTPTDYTLTVNPATDFPAATEIVVRVDAKDLDNNVMSTYQWSFNRPPTPPPVPPTCEELGCFSTAPAGDYFSQCPPATPSPASCPVPTICGNGVCEASETSETCRFDCAPVAPESALGRESLAFTALDKALTLPFQSGTVHVFPSQIYGVDWVNASASVPARVSLLAASGNYSLLSSDKGKTFGTLVTSPVRIGSYNEIVRVEWPDGRVSTQPYTLIVDEPFRVFDENGQAFAGVSATLYRLDSAGRHLVPSTVLHQNNPLLTDSSGGAAFVAAPGTYAIEAEAPGYLKAQTDPFTTASATITGRLTMRKAMTDVIDETIGSTQPLSEKISTIGEAAISSISEIMVAPLRRAQKDPNTQAVAATSFDGLVLATMAVLGFGAIAYGFLPALILALLLFVYERISRKRYANKSQLTLAEMRKRIAGFVEFLTIPLLIATVAVLLIRPTPMVVGLVVAQVLGFAVFRFLNRLVGKGE